MNNEAYEAMGIPYCKTCGDLFHTGDGGVPLCPIKKDGCERNLITIPEMEPETVEVKDRPPAKKKATPEA